MQRLIYLLFVSVFFLDYFSDIGILPRVATYVPELLSALMFVIILLLAAKQRRLILGISYWILFFIIAAEILLGIILNATPTGAVFAGIRAYLKYLPFFFLPAVYKFSDDEIRRQLLLLAGLSILQLPIAIWQRFITTEVGYYGGDRVVGSIGSSGILSIYLVCAFGVIYGLYLKEKLSRLTTAFLLVCVSLPTMLNETKATLVILPLAILVPVLAMESGKQKTRALSLSGIIFAVFILVFIPIYDYFIWDRYGYGLLTFFTMEGRVFGYLAPSISGTGAETEIGRIDALVMPFVELMSDPTKLLLGLGIGNVSISFLGKKFSGDFMEQYDPFIYGSFTKLQWEIGLIGIFLLLVFLYMIYRDSKIVSKENNLSAAFGLGWTCVPILMPFALLYSQIIANNAVSYLFWFYSGYIASEAMRIRLLKYNEQMSLLQSNMTKRFR